MKITKKNLERLIKEELAKILLEEEAVSLDVINQKLDQIIKLFGGKNKKKDNPYNWPRHMRLPGAYSLPGDGKKGKKKPNPADLIINPDINR